MVTTNSAHVAKRLALLRSHGMSREPDSFKNQELAFDTDGVANPWYYEMDEIGYNYRLPDVLCSLGRSQLKKLDRFITKRRELAAHYDRLLQPLLPVLRPVPAVSWSSHAYHLYVCLIDFDAVGLSRSQLVAQLRTQGIGTQVHYLPVHRQPYYQRLYGEKELSGADTYYAKCLSLPLFPSMTDQDVEWVCAALASLIPTPK